MWAACTNAGASADYLLTSRVNVNQQSKVVLIAGLAANLCAWTHIQLCNMNRGDGQRCIVPAMKDTRP
jgi:hypothetical protein